MGLNFTYNIVKCEVYYKVRGKSENQKITSFFFARQSLG